MHFLPSPLQRNQDLGLGLNFIQKERIFFEKKAVGLLNCLCPHIPIKTRFERVSSQAAPLLLNHQERGLPWGLTIAAHPSAPHWDPHCSRAAAGRTRGGSGQTSSGHATAGGDGPHPRATVFITPVPGRARLGRAPTRSCCQAEGADRPASRLEKDSRGAQGTACVWAPDPAQQLQAHCQPWAQLPGVPGLWGARLMGCLCISSPFFFF